MVDFGLACDPPEDTVDEAPHGVATVDPGQFDPLRDGLDSSVDFEPVRHHHADDHPGQLAGRGIGLDLGQVALQDRGRGSLPEVRFEHCGERHAPPGAEAPDAVRTAARLAAHRALRCCRGPR